MSRGVALDRRKRYEIAHGSGSPIASTKGNIYIDDTDEVLWTRAENSSWIMNDSEGWWSRTSDLVSPLNPGDGLQINSTNTTINSIQLFTQGGISIDASSYVLGKADTQIRLNGVNGVLLSNGTGTIGETLIGDAWLKIPDSEDVWGDMVADFRLVHLYSIQGDIKIETDSGTCNGSIYLDSSDDIDLDAAGSIRMHMDSMSTWQLAGDNDVVNQVLTISVSNSGAAEGRIDIHSSDLFSIGSTGGSVEITSFEDGEFSTERTDNSNIVTTTINSINSGSGGALTKITGNGAVEVGGTGYTTVSSTTTLTLTSSDDITISNAGTLLLSCADTDISASSLDITSATLNLIVTNLQIGGVAGATGSGTNVTVVNGIVTAVS